MNRRFSLTSLLLSAVLIANTFAWSMPLPAAEGRRLVLVTRDPSAASLSPQEVRKLYLGATVTKDGRTLVPLCNHTDAMAYEVFMQKVMYMSGPAYERALMTRFMRTTTAVRPPEYSNEKDLVRALGNTPSAVTYMWADKAEVTGLKVVAELWHDP